MMSTKNLEEHFVLQEPEEKQPNQGQCGSNTPKNKHDLEDVFSISTLSQCPVKDSEAQREIKDSKLTELISGPSLDKQGMLSHLQLASPLESVRELAEAEEESALRIPEDGVVLFNEQMVCNEASAVRYMSMATEVGGEVLERTILEQVMDSASQLDFANLESPMTEPCSSEHEGTDGSWLQEDASKFSVNGCRQVAQCSSALSGDQEVTEHQLTSKFGGLEAQLDKHSSVMSLQDHQPPKEEPMCQHLGELKDHNCEEENAEASVANQNLIEVLTACKAKVEQLEQLKSSSFDLSAQLHSAQVMAARLHQRVLCLEHEQNLKEKKLQELTVNLEKTSEALQVRTSQMATVTEELHQLHLEQEAKKSMATPARTITANGEATLNSQQQSPQNNSSTSKLCTLF